ncbi:phosphopantetheine-binding protein [Streptomyces sp. NPDC052396]|uniref:phosphopantetheine-binding protein n=1 Tax=Streptomyces sp. NPDC052396 TaxID=3365689 RepID=UPI0037D2A7C3
MTFGTDTEKAVADAWAVVLKKDGFGPDEDFFAIGGNSMLATVVTYRLRERFGAELPLMLIFEHPTVTELAVAIDQFAAGDE